MSTSSRYEELHGRIACWDCTAPFNTVILSEAPSQILSSRPSAKRAVEEPAVHLGRHEKACSTLSQRARKGGAPQLYAVIQSGA